MLYSNNCSQIIINIDQDYIVKRINSSALKAIKEFLNEDIVIGSSVTGLIKSLNLDDFYFCMDKSFDGETIERTRRFIGLNNGEYCYRISYNPVLVENSEVREVCLIIQLESEITSNFFERYINEEAVISIARDVSVRKSLEKKLVDNNRELTEAFKKLKIAQEQLIQSEKLAGIGQLAAGVAHEINNPLGYISSNFETSQKYFLKLEKVCRNIESFINQIPDIPQSKLGKEARAILDMKKQFKLDSVYEDLKEIFADIDDGLKRISEIVTGLKTFSRVEQGNCLEEYDLNKGISSTLLVTKNEVKYTASTELQLEEIPLIKVKGSQINQVLLNLILNSAHAIKLKSPDSMGIIKIRTYYMDGFVNCEIEDNGTGISQENINNIFNPFFTTKPAGQGTGLGLSIAYDIIVNKHEGEILVDSTTGLGTKFTIRLPVGKNKGDET